MLTGPEKFRPGIPGFAEFADGRIEYYLKSFGAIAVVLVEIKLRFKTINSRMKAVTQVVAECDGESDSAIQVCGWTS